MKRIICIAALALVFLQCAQAKTSGETSVQLDGISFLNALDDSSCKALNVPKFTGPIDPERVSDLGASVVKLPPKQSPCHDPLYVYPVISEGAQYVSHHRVTFYPKLTLRSGNNVVFDGDTVCVGDILMLESGITADYIQDGGNADCPAVNWAEPEKMEQILNKYLNAHQNENLDDGGEGDYPSADDMNDMIPSITPGMGATVKDAITGFDANSGTGIRDCVPFVYTNVLCTPNLKADEGTGKTITPKKTGPMEIKASFEPQCALLNSKSFSALGGYYGSPGIGTKDHNRVFIKPAGWTYVNGDLSGLPSYKSSETPWLKYIDKNARIDVSIKINVIENAERPKISVVRSSTKEESGKYAIRTVLKNTGNAKALIDKVSYNLKSYTILYKPDSIEAGAESEILAETNAASIMSLTEALKLDIVYRSEKLGCLKDRTIKDSFVLDGLMVLKPARASQVYMMSVTGACTNKYYSCERSTGESFYAGYKCFNKDPYYDPTGERFDISYDLSVIPAEKTVSSAILNLGVHSVKKDQSVTVYSANNKWEETLCIASGDICTQPYCPECSPLYDLGESSIGSVKIAATGSYPIDVSDYVRQKSSERYVSFQIRGSEEDRWGREGTSSCIAPQSWDKYDIEFKTQPGLTVLYN